MTETSTRLDARLVALGLATAREKAKELIQSKQITVNGKTVTKPSFPVTETDEIVSHAETPRFVGRGGYKLEAAIALFSPTVTDVIAADIGSSTGGFTECLLQHGARSVYAIDVGKDQLHPTLRADKRVISLEQTDIRDRAAVSAHIPDHSVDLAVTDVSFISLKLVVPAILPLLKSGGTLICLIKPQFEAGKAALDKRGVVRSPKDHERVIADLTTYLCARSLHINGLHFSPICGGDGNIEYLVSLTYDETRTSVPPFADEIARLVAQAHETLKPKKGR